MNGPKNQGQKRSRGELTRRVSFDLPLRLLKNYEAACRRLGMSVSARTRQIIEPVAEMCPESGFAVED